LTRSGDPLRALEVVAVTRELAGEDAALYDVPLERLRAQALVAMDRPDEAATHIERALASARAQRLAYEEALLLLLKAQTGIGGEGVFEEATRLLETLGASSAQLDLLPSPTL
jgi:hypothetical protein